MHATVRFGRGRTRRIVRNNISGNVLRATDVEAHAAHRKHNNGNKDSRVFETVVNVCALEDGGTTSIFSWYECWMMLIFVFCYRGRSGLSLQRFQSLFCLARSN